jgi:glycosyltransferase involved in cell wall biosynthesis
MEITLLLATYNGENYLNDFLNSLTIQTYSNWKLTIIDDCSTDKTLEIIDKWGKNIDKEINIKVNRNRNGPCKNFLALLSTCELDYIMFCDQDDVWLPEKIEKTLNKMLELENIYGKNTPILVHTDLIVVDEVLNSISPSFWKYQKLDPNRKSLNYLLIQNNVTGCTIMINKALKKLINPLPEKAIMHDWWCALVASAFGIIDYIKEPLILYRQHKKQNIGARKYSLHYFFNKFFKDPKKAFDSVLKTIHQAEDFYNIYKDNLPVCYQKIVKEYINLPYQNRFKRLLNIFKYKFFKHGLLRNIGFIGILILMKKRKNEKS